MDRKCRIMPTAAPVRTRGQSVARRDMEGHGRTAPLTGHAAPRAWRATDLQNVSWGTSCIRESLVLTCVSRYRMSSYNRWGSAPGPRSGQGDGCSHPFLFTLSAPECRVPRQPSKLMNSSVSLRQCATHPVLVTTYETLNHSRAQPVLGMYDRACQSRKGAPGMYRFINTTCHNQPDHACLAV